VSLIENRSAARRYLAGAVAVALAALWAQGALPGTSASSAPATGLTVRIEADYIVTADGKLPRPKAGQARPAGPITDAYVIPITTDISGATLDAVRRKIVPIKSHKGQLVIFNLDTPGGDGRAMAGIIRLIMQDLDEAYTVAYVNPKAFSAGALIAVACDEIVMSPTGQIGAAMPIWISPGSGVKEMPEKIRGKFESAQLAGARVMAQRNGYDEDLIEGMITIDRVIWLIRERETTEEVGSLSELARRLNITGEPQWLGDTWAERLVAFLTSMPVTTVLLFVGILALYAEFQSPGIGLPGAVAVLCFAVLFGSRYLTGLANWWEVALFALGVGLLLIEVFVTPGFGVLGIAGIVCCLVALLAMVQANPPDKLPWPETNFDWDLLTNGALAMVLGVLIALGAGAALSRYLPKVPFAGRLVLSPPAGAHVPPVMADAQILNIRVGQTGKVVQNCRPVGKVRIAGKLCDGIADGAFLSAGTEIVVLRNEGSRIVVEAKKT